MAKPKRSDREKLHDSKDLPRVQRIHGKMIDRWGRGTFVIPAPVDVDEMMRKVPKGKLCTVNMIREVLARRYGATMACPITTGIFANIAARAAAEDEQDGKVRITPYWRTLKEGGEVNAKFPGGVEVLRSRLEAEGHQLTARGSRWFVVDYDKRLANLPNR